MTDRISDRRIAETVIEPDGNGVRLDFYLQKRFSYRSRTEWQKSIAEGEILLNGKPTKPSRRLQTGEVIAFQPKTVEEPAVDSSFEILEETSEYLAVSKSGNLPCHPAGAFFKHTLWYLLRERYGENIHIATRLDRETSGVVLVARTRDAAVAFTRELMANRVGKRYLAFVHGDFPEEPVHASGWLSADPGSKIRKKRRFTEECPGGEAETAETDFRLIARQDGLSAVEALPATGRLHQIRATLCSLGYPMVGDKLYGLDDTFFSRFVSDSLTEEDRRRLILPRQALHAHSLEMPYRGGVLSFSAPLPADMKSVMDTGMGKEGV